MRFGRWWIRHGNGFAQMSLGRGWTGSRVIWWPRFGQISLRVWADWWIGLHWHRSNAPAHPRAVASRGEAGCSAIP